MENMTDVICDSEDREVIETTTINFDKEDLLEACIENLHTPKIIHMYPPTLFEVYDIVNQKDSGDEIHDEFTGHVLYPIRMTILKTIYDNLFDVDMLLFLRGQDHKTLAMASKARRDNMRHRVKAVELVKEVLCPCEKLVSKKLLACVHCKTLHCESCAKSPCIILLKDLIDADHVPDEEITGSGFSIYSFGGVVVSSGDDEETTSSGYHSFSSEVDDESSGDDEDEEMETDEEEEEDEFMGYTEFEFKVLKQTGCL